MMQLYQQRDFGAKINATFRYLVQHFRSLGLSLLYIAGPVVLVAGIASGLSESSVRGNQFGLFSRASLLSFGAYLLAFWLVPMVTYGHMSVYGRGEVPVLVGAVWREVRRGFGRAVVAIGLYGLAYGLGSVFFFVPGLYFGVTLSLMLPIVFLENSGPFDALGRSMTLIQNNWWSTLGLLVVMGLVYVSLLSLIVVPTFLWEIVRNVFQLPALPPLALAFLGALLVLALLLFSVVVVLAVGFQYLNLVEKREHIGLITRIDSIGTAAPETTPSHTDDEWYA
ncbi:hypothetical protein [Rudanella lutea]|uniref:hypothetical protein n=1 Tax=Rudanella lutea TaxID=451374 RepID=UPI00037430DE|nr:hypothetical protein [Rudanella lutea]